jgi:hypothetical protein
MFSFGGRARKMSGETYNNVNDFIRSLGPDLDLGHWINKESFRFIKRSEYDKTEVKLQHVPIEWLDIELECVNGHGFKPDWLAKTPPVSCFKLKEGLFRQMSRGVFCTVCGAECLMPIDQAKYRRESCIFGDEAFREVDSKTILSYSFVGFTGSSKSERMFKRDFDKAKKYLAPTMAPDDWVLHVTEILSSDKRKNIGYLSHLNRDRAAKGIRMALNVISRFANKKHLNVYSAASVVHGRLKGEAKLEAQSAVYNSALMNVISEYTKHGHAPMFYFERTGSDGWAKNLFDGGRLTLLWARLTHGIPVRSPEFVLPSHSYYLEIADIVSYVVARNLYVVGSRATGKNILPEFDTFLIGLVRYIWTDGDGGWNCNYAVGFPFSRMFAGTDWAGHSSW